MSHFAATLKRLCTTSVPPLAQNDLAERAGLSESTMSRICLGHSLQPSHVTALCLAISDDRARRLELLLAYLRDCAEVGIPAGLDERHFILRASDDAAPAPVGSMAAELDLIAAECIAHEDIRAVVSDLARMIRRHNAELLDAGPGGGTVYPIFADQPLAVAEAPASRKRRAPKSGSPRPAPPVPRPAPTG